MFVLLLRLKRRLRRLLKVQTESRQTESATVQSRTFRFLILIVGAVTIGVLYPGDVIYDPLDMPLRGEFARNDIRAPFPITVYKSPAQIEDEADQVRRFTPYVLDYDSTVLVGALGEIDRLTDLVGAYLKLDSAGREVSRQDQFDTLSTLFPNLSSGAIQSALAGRVDMTAMRRHLKRIYRENMYRVGIIRDLSELPPSASRSVLVRTDGRENLYDRARIRDLSLANARLTTLLNQLAASDSINVDLYYNVGRAFLQPNLKLNREEYERRVEEGLEQLTNVKRIVNEGDVIVSARQKVSVDQEEVLQEMVRIMRTQAAGGGWYMAFLPALARLVLVLAAFLALYQFLRLFRKDIARSNPKLLALVLVFGLQLFLIWVVDLLGLKSIYIYPVAVLPVIVTILFDAEVGLISTVLLALLLGVMQRFSFSLALLTAVVGFVGCISARRVRKRSDFYRIIVAIAAACVMLIFVVEKLKLTPNSDLLAEMLYGVSISIASVLIVAGVLPVFESLFGITTDTTLLELSDLNHPLLKRLSIEAPGTYHHSISVGNLCESAAEAIGANPLLARVGAYYHDIGKIEVPEYFVENQFSVRSKHDALTPSMSALILSSHVKKGRMLGEEADIPDDVLNFIEEHHGTMVMEYFYHRAKEQEGGEVDIDKFRYPGPKPQTRETGISMLADAVEAASRTLDDPKPARIDSLIQKIINNRFQSGELDECPLTLRDLARIKRAFAQVLIAAFHHRVKYPSGPSEK